MKHVWDWLYGGRTNPLARNVEVWGYRYKHSSLTVRIWSIRLATDADKCVTICLKMPITEVISYRLNGLYRGYVWPGSTGMLTTHRLPAQFPQMFWGHSVSTSFCQAEFVGDFFSFVLVFAVIWTDLIWTQSPTFGSVDIPLSLLTINFNSPGFPFVHRYSKRWLSTERNDGQKSETRRRKKWGRFLYGQGRAKLP